MDLKNYIDTLRVVARQNLPADGIEKVEQSTREYLQPEIIALQDVIKDVLRATEAEAKKKIPGEDWSLIQAYLKSCLERLPSVFQPGL